MKQALSDYDALHFAVHGVMSTKVPSRSALLLRAAGSEDGLLQAGRSSTAPSRRFATLSARDTGAGTVHGQDGVASLVRLFIAGERAVVANLWAADDRLGSVVLSWTRIRRTGQRPRDAACDAGAVWSGSVAATLEGVSLTGTVLASCASMEELN